MSFKKHQHHIEKISQPTDYTCWEASARIVFRWKYKGHHMDRYNKSVAYYLSLGRGLHPAEMADFYCNHLGMKARPVARLIIGKSPAIWRRTNPMGHAMVLFGFDPKTKRYKSWNPFIDAGQVDSTGGAQITAHSEKSSDDATASDIKGGVEILSEKMFEEDHDGSVWCYA